jgi:pimeloyl-ACP methyl ester carboxylesterase
MTPISRAIAAVAATILAAAALTGCTHSAASTPTLTMRTVTCPNHIELFILADHTCMRLRVPENRKQPAGRSVDLLVVRVIPPGRTSPDPMLNLGNDAGDTFSIGGFTALAERVHRVAYLLEARGTSDSTPSMACPEADQVRATTVDEAAALATAAHACLTRLRAAGDDPAWFGPADVAADADALRRALGITRWNLITYGSASVYAAELARTYPATVRSIVVDSPAPITSPYAGAGAAWTAWTHVATACRSTPACARAFPDVQNLWRRAALSVAAHPISVPGGPAGSGPLGAEGLARLVRAMLTGDGPAATAAVPAMLASLVNGRLPIEASTRLAADHDACLGYHPLCTEPSSLAVYLTALCPLLTNTSARGAPDLPGIEALDSDGMFAGACTGWPAAPPDSAELPDELPTLVLYGEADPFTDSAALDSWTHRPNAYLVDVPGQTHNAIGFNDCPIALRNAWVDQPTSPPPSDCLSAMPALPFVTR